MKATAKKRKEARTFDLLLDEPIRTSIFVTDGRDDALFVGRANRAQRFFVATSVAVIQWGCWTTAVIAAGKCTPEIPTAWTSDFILIAVLKPTVR